MRKRWKGWCGLVIGAVVFVTYQPCLSIGHEGSWWYLEWAAKFPFFEYLIQFFDPGRVTQGYRPMQGLMVLAEYSLFRVNADGYHLTQMGMHLVTCGLLFAIVERLSRNARLAFLTALLYAGFPAIHLAIFRAPGVIDPFAAIFYLGTIWLWIDYLESRRLSRYGLALGVFILALLSKEISILLPGILFLIDRWFVRRETNVRLLVRQYLPFFVVMVPYLLLELNVQSHGEFSSQFGYKLGPQVLLNLIPYLTVLTFPWYLDNFNVPREAWLYGWAALSGLALAAVVLFRRRAVTTVLFLLGFAALNIAPLLGFPQEWFQARYLYVPFMSTAVLMALALDRVWSGLERRGIRMALPAAALAVALLTIVNGQGVAAKAAEWTEYMRVVRVPFRDISRQHSTFPEDTYLYFAYPHTAGQFDLDGLFFVRYGLGIKVSTTEEGKPVEWRRHKAAFAYYFDATGRPIELTIPQGMAAQAVPSLPARWKAPVALESFDLSSTTGTRGKALMVVLNWMANAPLERDYGVFVHLLDRQGNPIARYDGPPRQGTLPASVWPLHNSIVDVVVLAIPADAPVGPDYRLEVGLDDPETGRPLSVLDARGLPATDRIVIGPLSID